jgi:hypothetical protein
MGTCIQNPLSGIPSSQFSNFSGTSTIDVDIADSLSYRTSHGTEEKRKKRGKTRKLSKESEGECEAEVVL